MEIKNFKQIKNVLSSNTIPIIIIYFYSISCHTSLTKIPILQNSMKNNNNIDFYIIDIDNNSEIVKELDITSIPLVKLYHYGKWKDDIYGTEICNSIIDDKFKFYLNN